MSASTSPLALEAPRREEPRGLVTLGVLLGAAAGLVLLGGLVAAYLGVRANSPEWAGADADLDNYLGVTVAVTLVMVSVAVEWANYATARAERRQAVAALLLVLGLGVAFLNLVWYTGRQLGFGPASSPHGTAVWALLGVVGALGAGGLVLAGATLARLLGGQVTRGDAEPLRATAWYWHLVTLAWVVVFFVVYVVQ